MDDQKPKLLPTVSEYLEARGSFYPISTVGLEFIAEAICSKTDLDYDQANKILGLYFQEIRNTILSGKRFYLKNIGYIYLKSPATTNNKKRIFVKLDQSTVIKKKINTEIK